MPEAEIFKESKKMMNNFDDIACLKSRNIVENLDEAFIIEFNEDGTPIDCHKVKNVH